MSDERQKAIPPSDQLEELFELIRSRDSRAFRLFETLFQTQIHRRLSRAGIPFSMWDTLYREVATNIWLSAPKLPGAASLPSRVVRETNTTIKHQVRHCLDSEFRLLLLDQLEALIHLLHDQTDPDTRRDITLQMDAIAKKLRRIG